MAWQRIKAAARVALAVFCCGLSAGLALRANAQSAGGPQPMLDTGGHMAVIRGIAFTPDGKQLVSASDDKTIRVWDVATGKTVRTIRGEVAPGSAGKIYAMALSPDGKWLAVGGWMKIPGQDGHHIRLYDFASGKLVAVLKGHEDVVYGLAFSPDGQHLISGSGDDTAIIWDVATAAEKYRLRGHEDHIYAVGFTPDGQRAVTSSYDHDLRLWRVADGGEIAQMRSHGDKVFSLAVAPDGTIASGDNGGDIRLWDGTTGAFLRVLARQSTAVGSLSFSPDGKMLLSGISKVAVDNVPYGAFVYDVASGREIVAYKGHDNVVMATAISPDGRWAATGGGNNHEIHLWDLRTGERRRGPDGQPLMLGGRGRAVWAVGFSADGRQLAWGTTWAPHVSKDGYGPLQYALTLPTAEDALPRLRALAAKEATAFRRTITELDGWSLSHLKGNEDSFDAILDVEQGGHVVASIERSRSDGYRHLSFSFTADGETIISGASNGYLTAYNRAGEKLGEFVGHEAAVWAVSPSSDGRYLLSGAADLTVRLWNLKTRELLVTLYHGTDSEWVMWTPQGYYAASPGGGKLVGWQINRGYDSAAGYVTAEQLREFLNRPDIVAQAIATGSAKDAAAHAPNTGRGLEALLATFPRNAP